MFDKFNAIINTGLNGFGDYFLANAVYSLSSFAINLLMPLILADIEYSRFVYVFQMVLYMTGITQIGLTYGLYRFYKIDKSHTLCIYYLFITILSLFLLCLGFFHHNYVNQLLKLDLNGAENLVFYISVIVSNLFLYNKGKNIADKSYRYMLRISVVVFVFRLCALGLCRCLNITSLPIILSLFFIIPFFQDIKDYIVNCLKSLRVVELKRNFTKSFVLYCFKIWIIGFLFTIADRMFLIQTKGLDDKVTTAVAFSSGFIGVISLFNSTFVNYFVSKLSGNSNDEIQAHISKLNTLFPKYMLSLVLICVMTGLFVVFFYSNFGRFEAVIVFLTILKAGLISYVGMYTLLSKVLDLLKLEIYLNIGRVIFVYLLCTLWHPESCILWYFTVMFSMLISDIILLRIIICRIKSR